MTSYLSDFTESILRAFEYLESLPWVIGAIIMVSLIVSLTILWVIIVRKVVSLDRLKAHHDVAGFVFTNLGVLYAVLLGFTVVNVQQNFDKIKDNAQIEASDLAELFHAAKVFPEDKKNEIRDGIRKYAESVRSEEWILMSKGVPSEVTIQALREIWTAFYTFEPSTPKEEIWYSKSIDKLNQLMTVRLARLLDSEGSLGSEMWSLLILGGVVIITFMSFFGLESTLSHILMASVLAATTAFLLFLIYSLDTAFVGATNVAPEAIERVINSFQREV